MSINVFRLYFSSRLLLVIVNNKEIKFCFLLFVKSLRNKIIVYIVIDYF
jgi:hypothetical protein